NSNIILVRLAQQNYDSTFNSVVFTTFCLRPVKFSLNSNRIWFSQIEDQVYTETMALVVFVNAPL
ncbi:hypothetical protein OFN62_32065, partial [Escherichia coli]|nr:hypothetical protein [Escherichia coli]